MIWMRQKKVSLHSTWNIDIFKITWKHSMVNSEIKQFHWILWFSGLTEIINDIEKGDYMKSLTPNSFSQSSEYLEMALSPKSVESQNSCRSHDGVFLRPGEQQKKSLRWSIFAKWCAHQIITQPKLFSIQNENSSPISSMSSNLPTMTSLLSCRLIKRTSVDSGINLDSPSMPSFRSTLSNRSRNVMNHSPLATSAMGLDASDSFLLCKYTPSHI